jgi:hypothetical protein
MALAAHNRRFFLPSRVPEKGVPSFWAMKEQDLRQRIESFLKRIAGETTRHPAHKGEFT